MDNRKFTASFSVRFCTQRIRFELSPAYLHGGPAGLYRVRMDRRWLDAEKGPRFFDRASLAALLIDTALGETADFPPAPRIAPRERVSVIHSFDSEGRPLTYEGGWTASPPILAYDGRWMVAVTLYGKGTVFVPWEHIIAIHRGKEQHEHP